MDHEALVTSIQTQQAKHPLSILALAEPLLSDNAQTAHAQSPTSRSQNDYAANSDTSAAIEARLNPASLSADLQHYRDLFSKLRFSYLEQVTKEKYLRSIVGDPPVLVTHDENLLLEDKLADMKNELKAKKEENERLVTEMEGLAAQLAEKYEVVQEGMGKLDVLPKEIEELRDQVEELRGQLRQKEEEMQVDASDDPRMNMSLADTEAAIEEQRQRTREIDEQIAALQKDLPPKMRECERAERELGELENKRDEVTRLAREIIKIKEEGGRDLLEEKGRWYRAEEQVLKALLGIEA